MMMTVSLLLLPVANRVLISYKLPPAIVVTVGYTHTDAVVETGEQAVTLNVSISSPLNVTLQIVFSLLVNTMDITAGMHRLYFEFPILI